MPTPPRGLFKRNAGRRFVEGCELLSCGRDALFRILGIEKFSPNNSLWIPEYFCPDVVRALRRLANVKFYKDFPSEKNPRFETLLPRLGDIVLMVNFFGLRRGEEWSRWRDKNPEIKTVEDHSHAPFSRWAERSGADYSFASLRKSLPLADGAYLKIKNSRPSKMFLSGGDPSPFAADMISAANIESFSGYSKAEDIYYAGEAKLNAKRTVSRMSKCSFASLADLDIGALSKRTSDNLAEFCRTLGDSDMFCELNLQFGNLDEPSSAFAPTLKFRDMRTRDKYYNALVSAGVMPSIYWGGLGHGVSAEAHAECDTMFTIPLDFRHTKNDARKLAKLILSV